MFALLRIAEGLDRVRTAGALFWRKLRGAVRTQGTALLAAFTPSENRKWST
jgi:hypothetical protein